MCAEQNIPYINHTNSNQPENHLKKASHILTGMRQWLLRIVYLSFSLSIIDGVMIVAIFIIFFKKTLTKNQKVSRSFHKKKTIGE